MKKLLAILLSLVMVVLLFSGCGEKEGPPTKGANGETAKENNDEAKDLNGEEAITIKLLGNLIKPEDSPMGKNAFDKIEEEFNVKFEIEVPPSANYKEKVQLTVASGDLPDAILFDSTEDTLLKSMVENGDIISINDLLATANNINDYTLQSSFNALRYKNDDQIFGIPRSTVVRADGIIIRKDWLDNLGITGISEGEAISLDQFNELMVAFSDKDPDGNGKDDTYGLRLHVNNNSEMVSLYEPFSLGFDGVFNLFGWQESEGEYDYMDLKLSKDTDNFKELLSYIQNAYTSGYLDPQWPIIKKQQAEESLDQGLYGMSYLFPTHLTKRNANAQLLNPDAEFIWIPGILNPKSNKVQGTSFSTGAWGAWTITTACEHPEKVVEVFNYMLSDEFYYEYLLWGTEGLGYTVEDGVKVPTETYSNPNEGTGWMNRTVRRAGDPEIFLSLNNSPETIEQYKEYLTTAIGNAVGSLHNGYVPPAALEAMFIDYRKQMNDVITKIIVGDLPVDAYDEALDRWYEYGGEDYIVEMNAHINAMQ